MKQSHPSDFQPADELNKAPSTDTELEYSCYVIQN